MSNIMDKLLAEEKEAEAMMYGDKEEAPSEEALSPEQEEEVSAPEGESTEAESEAEVAGESEKPKRVNWKKRFIGYKSATDDTLRELRERNHYLENQQGILKTQLNELSTALQTFKAEAESKKDPFEGVFSQEDVDLLGPEALAAMKKAALATKSKEESSQSSAELKALKAELNQIKQQEKARQQARAKKESDDSLESMKVKLAKMIPQFEAIDSDPNFTEFLNDLDSHSDHIRLDLFSNAVNQRDVAGAARFYKEYAQLSQSKESFLDDYVTPAGDGATQSDPQARGKKHFHVSEYESFMDDLTKGKYKGREKEAQKLEMMFDKAFMEDRIYE